MLSKLLSEVFQQYPLLNNTAKPYRNRFREFFDGSDCPMASWLSALATIMDAYFVMVAPDLMPVI